MSRISMNSADMGASSFDTAATAPTGSMISWIRNALAVRRQRRALLALDSRMLADIGLSDTDAYREASRSMFDLAETHRRRA